MPILREIDRPAHDSNPTTPDGILSVSECVTFQLSEHRETICIPCEVFTNNISQFAEWVGKGSFGDVFRYPRSNLATRQTVALKQLHFGLNSSKSDRDGVIKEIETHRKLVHPNIVKYIGCYETENVMFIIMDYLPQGSLYQKLKDIENRSIPALQEATILRYTAQILDGLVYLHSYSRDPNDRIAYVTHRDLRSTNILIDSLGNLKLADFGLSKKSLDTLASQSCTAGIGNIYWRSPEMIMGLKEKIGRKVDVWSLGVTLLEMIFVDLPTIKLSENRFESIIKNRAEFEKFLDDYKSKICEVQLVNLIDKCLTYEADERPTSLELLKSLQNQ